MAKTVTKPESDTVTASTRDPLIKTVAEHDALSAAEKQAFRAKGGTVVENHVFNQ